MATTMTDAAAGAAALQQEAAQAVQRGDVPAAIAAFERLLAIAPGNPDILSNLGKLHYMSGDLAAAIARFGEASAAAPGDAALSANYHSALLIDAGNLSAAGDFAGAIARIRTVLAADPGHANARIDLANALALSGARAELADFLPGTTPGRLGRHALIACMPKSGSSFLKEALCALTGWADTPLTFAYLQNEQEIYLPYLQRAAASDTVTQQHCRATAPNVQILQAFGIRPVVLVRRLEDIAVSLADFYDQGATSNSFFAEAWPGLDRAAKLDLIVDHVMPWYAAFHASWERAARNDQLDCLMVSYEEMIADKPGTLAAIAGFLGLGKSEAECAAAVRAAEGDAARTRLNKGGAGRGAEALSDAQKTRLRRLFDIYPGVDLERVGLAA